MGNWLGVTVGEARSGAGVDAPNAEAHDEAVCADKRLTYVVGILLLVPLWLFVVGVRHATTTPLLWLGLLFGILFLAVNAIMARAETVSTYAQERDEASAMERNSFYIVASLFTFGALMSRMDSAMTRQLMPLIIAALFTGIVLIMPPVWLSTEDPKPTIWLKHARSVATIYSATFVTTALIMVMVLSASAAEGTGTPLGELTGMPGMMAAM